MLLINNEYAGAIVQHIRSAKSLIELTLFHDTFNSKVSGSNIDRIIFSLVEAKKRGVTIKIFCNSENQVERFRRYNFQIKKARGFKTMHAKAIIFDREILIMGSHNLSENAMTTNLEISVILNDREIINKLTKYLDILWQ